MNHFASPEFWFHYRQLPAAIREFADKNFAILKSNSQFEIRNSKFLSRFKPTAFSGQVEDFLEDVLWKLSRSRN